MFRNVLVAVDGSEAAWQALTYGQNLAEQFSGRLLVLTVMQTYPVMSLAELPTKSIFAAEQELLKQQCELILQEAKKRLTGFAGEVEYLREIGHPGERILAVASGEHDVDVIVLGSRGLSGIEEFFLGSVSSKVAQRAHVPVLVVR